MFFPSYSILEQTLDFWQHHQSRSSGTTAVSSSIYSRLSAAKECFREPRNVAEFTKVVLDYTEAIRVNEGRGALLFAVCRGKASEGIDFANANARAVIITGLPFAPTKSPKIVLKREHLAAAAAGSSSSTTSTHQLSPNAWYIQQAIRAVNQAIGRVIRHKGDFGAILLCDERFGQLQHQQGLSQWLQPHVRVYGNYGEVNRSLSAFYKQNGCIRDQDLSKVSSSSGSSLGYDNHNHNNAMLPTTKRPPASQTTYVPGQTYIPPNELLPSQSSPLDPRTSTTPLPPSFFQQRQQQSKRLLGTVDQENISIKRKSSSLSLTESVVRQQQEHQHQPKRNHHLAFSSSSLSHDSSSIPKLSEKYFPLTKENEHKDGNVRRTSLLSHKVVDTRTAVKKFGLKKKSSVAVLNSPFLLEEEEEEERSSSILTTDGETPETMLRLAQETLGLVHYPRFKQLIKTLNNVSSATASTSQISESATLKNMCQLLQSSERYRPVLASFLSFLTRNQVDQCQHFMARSSSSSSHRTATNPSTSHRRHKTSKPSNKQHHHQQQHRKKTLDNPQCMICLETSSLEEVYAAPCGHLACSDCWTRVLTRPLSTQPKCPQCQHTLPRVFNRHGSSSFIPIFKK